jgi:hypothetical protein
MSEASMLVDNECHSIIENTGKSTNAATSVEESADLPAEVTSQIFLKNAPKSTHRIL